MRDTTRNAHSFRSVTRLYSGPCDVRAHRKRTPNTTPRPLSSCRASARAFALSSPFSHNPAISSHGKERRLQRCSKRRKLPYSLASPFSRPRALARMRAYREMITISREFNLSVAASSLGLDLGCLCYVTLPFHCGTHGKGSTAKRTRDGGDDDQCVVAILTFEIESPN